MEAAGVGCAARNDEAPLLSPTNGSVKKKFRARKTMTASCRQQLATLKLKNSPKSESIVNESFFIPSKTTVQEPELICDRYLTAQDNSTSKINKSQGVFPNGLKVSIEVSKVDSGINIGCLYNETWKGISKKSEDVPSNLLSSVKNPINLSHTTHFVVRDFNTATTENHITSLDQVRSPAHIGSPVLSEDTLLTTESTIFQDVNVGCEQTDFECSTISENLNASITLKIIDEDQGFKKTSSIDIVTPTGLPDTNSAVVPTNELDPDICTSHGSNALTSPLNLSTVSHSVRPEEVCDATVGNCKKKRTLSESNDSPDTKRAKPSKNVLLDEIQCLIDKRINILFENVFEQRMQALTRQVDLVRKNGTHADIARHLVCNTDAIPNASTVIPPAEATETLQRTPSALNPTTKSMELVVLSDNESEQQSNLEPFQTERPNNPSTKMDSAAMKKIMDSIMEHNKRAHSSRTEKTVKTVIDLTDDEGQKSDKDSKMVTEECIPNGGPSASATMSQEKVSVENVSDKHSVMNDLTSGDNNESSLSCDVKEGKQAIPKSPSSEKIHESVAILKTSSNPECAELKPPQKPHLRLAQVQNPKGIALSWNIHNSDPSCAPAKAYCLYVHQGDPNNPKKLWKKIGEIKALPLPMACTLTQFVEDTTYSFAMRAKDANGRFGPLCDIQSTTLKPLSSSKK
ncbi:activating transcription factor 7-interacting protein 2 isoform X2 [Rhinoderma darwinii]|uniref:activating transcription factor 7-interacting protein 2 isoform X2 n=1 Tax=Rhinoderma darwinii TaxID=43563 RepID=UPI003F67B388